MYTNEVLDEVWKTKDRLWEEADGDVQVFLKQLQEFSRKNPQQGPVLRTAEEIQRYLELGELPVSAVAEDEATYGGATGSMAEVAALEATGEYGTSSSPKGKVVPGVPERLLTVSEAAKEIGASRHLVLKAMNEHGIAKHQVEGTEPPRVSATDIPKLKELAKPKSAGRKKGTTSGRTQEIESLLSKMTNTEIASKTGKSQQWISYVRKRHEGS